MVVAHMGRWAPIQLRATAVDLMSTSPVKPHNTGGLFVIMAIIGICGISVLPVSLELGCELTRNADGSSAILWFA